MNQPLEPNRHAAPGITRRHGVRYGVDDLPISLTWLHDWQTIHEDGTLFDISEGGLGIRMMASPAQGHLLHARFPLTPLLADGAPPVELDARVCSRQLLHARTAAHEASWHVHLAIESIHPVDEKTVHQALETLRIRASGEHDPYGLRTHPTPGNKP